MVEIMFAAQISQIEARNAKGPDWRHAPLRPRPARLIAFVLALSTAATALVPALAPRPEAPANAPTVAAR